MIEEITLHLFIAISGVAATFAGFSGVVAVFGRRAHGEWQPEESFRLENMLIMSLLACFSALVPLITDLFQVSRSTLWVFSSVLLAAACMAYFFYAIPKMNFIDSSRPKSLKKGVEHYLIVAVGSVILLQILNITGLVFARGPGPYATGLLLLLSGAGLQFELLILEPFKYVKSHEKMDEFSPVIRFRK